MSNETKRDVFEDAIFWAGKSLYTLHDTDYAEGILGGLHARYATALPDDIAVIPEAVGELIRAQKQAHLPLSPVMGALDSLALMRTEPSGQLAWVKVHEDAFARAWLDGVWRVEETGEIVKLEVKERDEH